MLVARFHEYGAAHRAFCELIRFGVAPEDISIIAGDRSNRHGASRDFGLLAAQADDYVSPVRRGMTLLAVLAEPMQRPRVAEIVEAHAPADIEERIPERAAADDRRSPSDTSR
jgi:hypothetical protein